MSLLRYIPALFLSEFSSNSRVYPPQLSNFLGKLAGISVSCKQHTFTLFLRNKSVTMSFLFGKPRHKLSVEMFKLIIF